MATSAGSFSLTGCNVELRYDVLSQSQANNTSTVRFYVILNVTNNYISWSSGSAWVHNSGSVGIGTYYSKGSHTILTRDFTFTHNSDGNLTIRPGYGLNTSFVSGSSTATIVLPKINRYAVTNSVSGSDIEGQFSVNYTKYISSYTQKLRISLPNIVELEKIDYNTSGETFTLSQATIDSLLQRYTTVSSFNLGFAIETWNSAGTSRLSEGNEKIITATIQNADPTFTHTELETDTKVAQLLGTSASTIVKNISKVKVTVVPTALKSSTIRNVKVTHDGNVYTDEATPYEMTIPVTASDFIVSVTDSRNNQTTETISKTLIDYEPFKIQELKFERPNATSSNVILNLKATYYQLTVGSTVNAPVVKWRLDDGTETTIPVSAMTIDNTTHTLTISNYTLTNVLSHERSGTFYISLEDIFSTDSNSQVVNKGIPTFEAGEYDFQVNGDLYVADTLGENKVNVLDKMKETHPLGQEIKTNKVWYNGKPIYRKVMQLDRTIFTGTLTNYSHGISNIDDTTYLFITWQDTSSSNNRRRFIPANYYNTLAWATQAVVENAYIVFELGETARQRIYSAGMNIFVVIEYTKTTDTATI